MIAVERRQPEVSGAGAASPAALEASLALAGRLLGEAEAFAVQFSDLGVIELPPAFGAPADTASLKAAATMYLGAELEAAMVLPAVEMLAGLFARGAFTHDLGPGGLRLHRFWRGRDERFTRRERSALFVRLFGAGYGVDELGSGGGLLGTRETGGAPAANDAFDLRMIDLCEALMQMDRGSLGGIGRRPYEEARLAAAAGALVSNIAPRAAGIVTFAARDILNANREALDILKETAVQRAVGAHGVWAAVERISARYLGVRPSVSSRVARGQAGVTVLAWLSGQSWATPSGGPMLPAEGGVIAAGVSWLQASLALAEGA